MLTKLGYTDGKWQTIPYIHGSVMGMNQPLWFTNVNHAKLWSCSHHQQRRLWRQTSPRPSDSAARTSDDHRTAPTSRLEPLWKHRESKEGRRKATKSCWILGRVQDYKHLIEIEIKNVKHYHRKTLKTAISSQKKNTCPTKSWNEQMTCGCNQLWGPTCHRP